MSFLPYLWGIETLWSAKGIIVGRGFYPTYEALKQASDALRVLQLAGFYPTYEALKR